MSNPYYTHGSFPSTGAAATSASMRAELDLISAAFDKLPTLASNANKFVVVNSTATGLTTTSTLPAASVNDSEFTIQDTADTTRKFQFVADSITPGATRLFTMPDADTTLVGTTTTQTLTNKTLTSPVIGTIVNTGTLTLPTSTDTLVGRATTDTLTNKTLTAPVIATISNSGTLTLPTSTDTLVGRATTDTLTNKTISGSNNTLSNIANSSLTNSSVTIGSSSLSLGGTLTTLAGVTISGASNTLSNIANASLTNSSITVNSTSIALGGSATITAANPNAITVGTGLQLNTGTTYDGSAARTISIDSTVATLSGSQTLSNKTISGSSNTLSNIANASLTNSSITIGSSSISLGSTASSITGLTSLSSTGLVMTANAASSTAISAIAQSAGTVTVTAAGHGLTSGDLVSIDGVADYTYCGLVTVNVTNANVFTYSATTTNSSSSGGYVTKLQGTWASYSGGTGPAYKGGPLVINASSQMPALRVTQGGNGYAFIVEDAANPDTSAFIISNAGDLAINVNKFTVASATGNTLIAGTGSVTGDFAVNTNKFTVASATGNTLIAGTTSLGGNVTFATDATYDIGASGATRPRDLYLSRNLVVGGTLTLAGGVNLNGNVTIGDASTDTLTVNSTITSNLIFTDNTYDIGASGATRPRNFYLAGNETIGGNSTLGTSTANTLAVNSLVNTNLQFTDNTYSVGASGANRPNSVYITGNYILDGASSGYLKSTLLNEIVAGADGSGFYFASGNTTYPAVPIILGDTGITYLQSTISTTGAYKWRFGSTNRATMNNTYFGYGTTGGAYTSGMSRWFQVGAIGTDEAVGVELVGNRNSSGQTVGRISGYNTNSSVEVARIELTTGTTTSLGLVKTYVSGSATPITIVTDNGLGIGTGGTTPSFQLDVGDGATLGYGVMRLNGRNVASEGPYIRFDKASTQTAIIGIQSAIIGASTSNNLMFWTKSGTGLSIATGGNTSSPAFYIGTGQNVNIGSGSSVNQDFGYTLGVVEAAKAQLGVLSTASYAAGVGGAINLGGNYRSSGDFSAFVRIAAEKTNATNGDYSYGMSFYTTQYAGANFNVKALAIADSGQITVANTGYGITYSSSGGNGLRIYGAAGTDQWDFYLNSNNIRLSNNTGSTNSRLVVDGGINASGANTASPTSGQSSSIYAYITTANNAFYMANLVGGRAGGEYGSVGYGVAYDTSTANVYYYAQSDTASLIRFNTGKIETLTAGASTAGTQITFTTGPYVAQGGTSWTNSSDERRKVLIEPITNALAKVRAVRKVIGRFKDDPVDKRRSFFIAQDFQQHFPEVVDVPEIDFDERTGQHNWLGIQYTDTIPLIAAALEELADAFDAYVANHP